MAQVKMEHYVGTLLLKYDCYAAHSCFRELCFYSSDLHEK